MADRQVVRHPDQIGTFEQNKMFFVYILENSAGQLYIGQTDDLQERVARHNRGGKNYTSKKGPWKIIFVREFLTRSEAIEYEKYLKSLKNSNYIKANIVS